MASENINKTLDLISSVPLIIPADPDGRCSLGIDPDELVIESAETRSFISGIMRIVPNWIRISLPSRTLSNLDNIEFRAVKLENLYSCFNYDIFQQARINFTDEHTLVYSYIFTIEKTRRKVTTRNTFTINVTRSIENSACASELQQSENTCENAEAATEQKQNNNCADVQSAETDTSEPVLSGSVTDECGCSENHDPAVPVSCDTDSADINSEEKKEQDCCSDVPIIALQKNRDLMFETEYHEPEVLFPEAIETADQNEPAIGDIAPIADDSDFLERNFGCLDKTFYTPQYSIPDEEILMLGTETAHSRNKTENSSVPETTAAGKTDHQNTDKDFDDFEFEIDTMSIDEFYSEYNPKQVKCGLLGAGS
ncbi:MAG: hypothetical protein K5752_05395 [Succinivibrionaceae bacterium]|nr:hypothetical protein [Succinivibrionaceae bacterium]